MPGITRELTNRADFPRTVSPVGDELIPAMRPNGEPVAIQANAAFSVSILATIEGYVGPEDADYLAAYTTARDL